MKAIKLILRVIGIAFMVMGISITLFALFVAGPEKGIIVPLIFAFIGAGFLIATFFMGAKTRKAIKYGTKYAAKIYGYTENKSYTVNDAYTMNTIVHYFDTNGIEREAVLDTGFISGSGKYPIGMTIDIYEYNGTYGYDEGSVRHETLPREAELMDNKPIDPSKFNTVALTCPNCGASFEAAQGYVNRCPYCNSYLNA